MSCSFPSISNGNISATTSGLHWWPTWGNITCTFEILFKYYKVLKIWTGQACSGLIVFGSKQQVSSYTQLMDYLRKEVARQTNLSRRLTLSILQDGWQVDNGNWGKGQWSFLWQCPERKVSTLRLAGVKLEWESSNTQRWAIYIRGKTHVTYMIFQCQLDTIRVMKGWCLIMSCSMNYVSSCSLEQ